MIIVSDTSPINYLVLLEEAAKKNLLDFPDAVDRLSRTSFYMPPDEIIQAALKRDQERKDRG